MKEALDKHEKLKREMQLSKEAKEQKERDRIEHQRSEYQRTIDEK
jgi:hypothetical protein